MMFIVPQASLHCNTLKYVYFTVSQHVVEGPRLEALLMSNVANFLVCFMECRDQ